MAKYRTLKGTTPSTTKRKMMKAPTVSLSKRSPVTMETAKLKSYSKRSRKYGVPGGRIGPPKPKK